MSYVPTPEEEKGMRAEARFFEIMARAPLPSWITGIVRSTPHQDACGIDAVALVTRRKDGVNVRVPIQIKSSYAGVAQHLLKYPHDWQARMVLAVVNDDMHDRVIVAMLMNALRHVQSHCYDYEDIFNLIEDTWIRPQVLDGITTRRQGAT